MSIPPPDAAGAMSLQFDSAEPAAAVAIQAQSIECAFCRTGIEDSYYEVAGKVACSRCRAEAQTLQTEDVSLARPIAFGIGAAIIGAIIYGTVLVGTGYAVGLVALLVGYLVGAAVRKGSRGRGGRPQQGIAAALTYLSVAAVYIAVGLANGSGPLAFITAPLVNGGPITVAIIAFSVFRAWRMNEAATLSITGPYRVGTGEAQPEAIVA
jgi:hypothetical protein